MKKNLSFLVLALFVTNQLFSQITYESSDFAVPGENYEVINLTDGNGLDFTQTGENHNWDYSSLAAGTPESYGYEDPNNSPYKALWCQYHQYTSNCDEMFNLNFNLGIGVGQNFSWGDYDFTEPYQHLINTGVELQTKLIGANVDLGILTLPLIMEYNDPDVLFRFPLLYNSSYTDTNSIDMDLSILGIDLQITAEGGRTTHVEGHGSLLLHGHVFPSTLKVKSSLEQSINVYLQGLHTEIAVSAVTYYWFDKDYGIPVLVVAGVEVGGTFVPNLITCLFTGNMSVGDLSSKQTMVYPNPTSGEVNLILYDNEIIKTVQVYDQTGRLVNEDLDFTMLPKGIYNVKVETSKRIFSERIIRK